MRQRRNTQILLGDWNKLISGVLPNHTVWWLSTDRKKIWIESEELEQEKFKKKGYNIMHGRMFHIRKGIGELTTSRLDSRRYKEAWIIKLEAMLDVYPELDDEIILKEIEEKKKKRSNINIRNIKVEKKEKKSLVENIKFEKTKEVVPLANKEIQITRDIEIVPKLERTDNKKQRAYFDADWPYVTWIKEEIDKNGEMVIPLKYLKEKMGEEFVKMQDMRIYFGLNKIFSNIGIIMELQNRRSEGKIESIAVIKRS